MIRLELEEWRQRAVGGVTPTQEDRDLALWLAKDGSLNVDWLPNEARVTSTSYVGTVQFSSFTVQVVPKLAGGKSGLLSMVRYGSGLEALRRLPRSQQFQATQKGLADVWCLLLADESENLLRNGLLTDYVWHEEDLPALRGRLLIQPQVTKHYGLVSPLQCLFEELDSDIVENTILYRALRLASRLPIDHKLARKLNVLASAFGEFCADVEATIDELESKLAYHRRNQHYRPAHVFALLLLRNLRLRDIYGLGRVSAFAFLIDMNPLFEAFVSRLTEQALEGSGTTVYRQATTEKVIIDADTRRSYKRVRPDLLLQTANSTSALPVDCKYKLYDSRPIDPADLYQIFFYAFAYRLSTGDMPAGVLMYPSDDLRASGKRLVVIEPSHNQVARLRSIPIVVTNFIDKFESGQLSQCAELHTLRDTLLAELGSKIRTSVH